MNKDTAVRLLALADECTNAIAALVQAVKEKAPGRGADFFDSGTTPIWGKVVMAFMSPAWDQHPELAPPDEIPPDLTYDPDCFNLPKELVIQASQSLSRVERLVGDIRRLLDASELTPDERERFQKYLAEIDADLAQQQYSARDQHPAFRGPEPREQVPEVPSNSEYAAGEAPRKGLSLAANLGVFCGPIGKSH